MENGYTGTRYEPAGIVHRGSYLRPDGAGGFIHAYWDGEIIRHYKNMDEIFDEIQE